MKGWKMGLDRWLTGAILLLMTRAPLSWGQERAELIPLWKNDRNVTTGPEVGEKIPDFQAVDRGGKTRDFDSLKGSEGLVFLVVRSADW